jgi:hypothetical protein
VRAHLVLLDGFHGDDVNFVVGRERRVNSSAEKFGTSDGSDAFVLVLSLEITLVREIASSTFVNEVEDFRIGSFRRRRGVETVGEFRVDEQVGDTVPKDVIELATVERKGRERG